MEGLFIQQGEVMKYLARDICNKNTEYNLLCSVYAISNSVVKNINNSSYWPQVCMHVGKVG